MIATTRKRRLSRNTLPWAPPTLSSPRIVDITNGNTANRVIELEAGEDCEIRFLEVIEYSPIPWQSSLDAQVTVIGGRNVVVMGAQTALNSHPETALTAPAAADATALAVASTVGFPDAGVLRVAGEGVRYSAKTATTFTIAERNFGFFNGIGTPPLAFTTGEKVYIGEQYRGALSFRHQTGFAHVEGALLEGTSLVDGIRVRGSAATTVTVSNSRIGPVGPADTVTMQDGHADSIQTWGSGVKSLRLSHVSLIAGVNGRALINSANTSGGGPVERITMLDTDMLDYFGRRQSLLTNGDPETEWVIGNAWLVTKKNGVQAAPELHAKLSREIMTPTTEPLISRGGLGIGYVSPGYA